MSATRRRRRASAAKLEAQVAIQNLNLDQLPRVSSVFEATQNMDVGFILDARGVSAGNQPGNGRITARILSDGPALLVEIPRHRRSRRRQRPGERAHRAGRLGPDRRQGHGPARRSSGRSDGKRLDRRIVEARAAFPARRRARSRRRDGAGCAAARVVRAAAAHDRTRHARRAAPSRARSIPSTGAPRTSTSTSPPTIPAAGSTGRTCPASTAHPGSTLRGVPRRFRAVQRHA